MRNSATSLRRPSSPVPAAAAKSELWPLAGMPVKLLPPRWNSPQEAEHVLLAQTKLLNSVLDGMGDGMVVADTMGRFLIWNAAAKNLLGPHPGALPTAQWPEFFGLYDPVECDLYPSEQLPIARALRGESCDSEILIRTPRASRSIWVEATGCPLKDQAGRVIGGLMVLRDITARKISQQQIKKLQEELESQVLQRTAQLDAANRELESFSSSVAHDLRAPLRHIAGFAEILLDDFSASLDPQAREYLSRIQQGIRRMGVLADELLNLARVGRQSLNLQLVDLTAIAREAVEQLKPEYADREVEWKIDDLPPAHGDGTLLRELFLNLISNALKYSRPRTHAVIEIGYTEREDPPAVFVRDNGVGFNMKYADKLFGAFQRLHTGSAFEGTGVGLAIVQRIAQKHRGQVWAHSEPERGATFYFTFKGLGNKQTVYQT